MEGRMKETKGNWEEKSKREKYIGAINIRFMFVQIRADNLTWVLFGLIHWCLGLVSRRSASLCFQVLGVVSETDGQTDSRSK